MSAATPHLCINCTHIFTAGESAQRFPLCTHPNHGVSLVTGQPLRPACEALRQPGRACGPHGALYDEAAAAQHTAQETLRQAYRHYPIPPEPGTYWEAQQAWYAGLMVAPDGRQAWHLLLPNGLQDMPRHEWGCTEREIEGASSIYDGHANTLAMAEAGSALAQAVRARPGNCYLPSRAEALMLFATLRERFEANWYWTSTQYSADTAWMQYFDYGDQGTYGKSFEGRARAVRRLVLESFNPFGGA